MKHTILGSLAIVAAASIALPAFAFFSELDTLKDLLASAQATPEAGMAELVAQIDASPAFTDVDPSQWYYSHVAFVADLGFVSGYRDTKGRLTGRFGPSDPVTVAQFLKMALKLGAIDIGHCGETVQHPQAAAHWAREYVACGEALGMRALQGGMNLDAPATRGLVLTMIHDALRVDIPPMYSTFLDTKGHSYEKDIALAYVNGVVTGDTKNGSPTGNFRPNDPLNRSEATALITRALETYIYEAEEEPETPDPIVISMNVADFSFTPTIITVQKGVPVTLNFTVNGTHTFVLEQWNIRKVLKTPTDSLTFTPADAGTFQFFCDMPGHRGAGMAGTIVVQ